jgi:hypothetical protein
MLNVNVEANKKRLQAELREFGSDATVGSPKLKAIGDVWRQYKFRIQIAEAQNSLAKYPNKAVEDSLAALELRQGQNEDRIEVRQEKVPGYDTALTRLKEIALPLHTAYYQTTLNAEKLYGADSKIANNLKELREGGLKRTQSS